MPPHGQNGGVSLLMAVNDPARSEIRLVWGDRAVSRLPYVYLRSWCPCVVCVGGHGREKHFTFMGKEPRRCEVTTIHRMGNYAILPVFADGHDTGIFHFDYLRSLDPALSRHDPDSWYAKTPEQYRPLAEPLPLETHPAEPQPEGGR